MAQRQEPNFAVRTVVVEGSGEFPLDMLRRDNCSFLTPADKDAAGDGYVSERRRVTLQLLSEDRHMQPNVERWKSFDWTVIGGVRRNTGTFSIPEERLPARMLANEAVARAQGAALTPNERLLLEALRPLAALAQHFDQGPGGHKASDVVVQLPGVSLTASDVWRAAKAVKAATGNPA